MVITPTTSSLVEKSGMGVFSISKIQNEQPLCRFLAGAANRLVFPCCCCSSPFSFLPEDFASPVSILNTKKNIPKKHKQPNLCFHVLYLNNEKSITFLL